MTSMHIPSNRDFFAQNIPKCETFFIKPHLHENNNTMIKSENFECETRCSDDESKQLKSHKFYRSLVALLPHFSILIFHRDLKKIKYAYDDRFRDPNDNSLSKSPDTKSFSFYGDGYFKFSQSSIIKFRVFNFSICPMPLDQPEPTLVMLMYNDQVRCWMISCLLTQCNLRQIFFGLGVLRLS